LAASTAFTEPEVIAAIFGTQYGFNFDYHLHYQAYNLQTAKGSLPLFIREQLKLLVLCLTATGSLTLFMTLNFSVHFS